MSQIDKSVFSTATTGPGSSTSPPCRDDAMWRVSSRRRKKNPSNWPFPCSLCNYCNCNIYFIATHEKAFAFVCVRMCACAYIALIGTVTGFEVTPGPVGHTRIFVKMTEGGSTSLCHSICRASMGHAHIPRISRAFFIKAPRQAPGTRKRQGFPGACLIVNLDILPVQAVFMSRAGVL